jgi:hypothetical protein
MADHKATQNLLSQKGLPFFAFYTEGDKPVKAAIRHLPSNTSSEDITVALQELEYEVISVKQMTAKRPTPAGGVSLVSLPLFLITLVRNQKSQEIFKLANLSNIIVRVEVYKSKSATNACALATFGSTAGSPLAACRAGVVMATENIRRMRMPRVYQAAATAS